GSEPPYQARLVDPRAGRESHVLHVTFAVHHLQPMLLASTDLEHERLWIDRAQHTRDFAFRGHHRHGVTDMACENLVWRGRSGDEPLFGHRETARIAEAAHLYRRGIDRRSNTAKPQLAAVDVDLAPFGDQGAARRRRAVGVAAETGHDG